MATAKKQKYERFTTPIATAKYPRINEPDTKFNKNGVYTIKAILSAEESAPIEAKLTAVAKAAFEQAQEEIKERISEAKGEKLVKAKAALKKLEMATLPVSDEVDDDGEPTGNRILSFKMNASYPSKKDKDVRIPISPKLFDAQGAVMARSIQVWGGSRVRVSADLVPFYNASKDNAGVSLRLAAVQVVELVSGGEAKAENYGFSKEEGGFDSSTVEPEKEESAPATTGGGDTTAGDDVDF